MSIRGLRSASVVTVVALLALSRPIVIGAEKTEQLIVKCAKPCAGAIGAVAAVGGETTYVYDNVDAIAVSVPASRVADLTFAVGADAVRKDVTVTLPPREVTEVDNAIAANALSGDAIAGFVGAQPANYNYNNSLTNAAPLHAAGSIGNNVVVALIDSGTASATPALASTVIGGENFVPAVQDPVTSATSRLNDFHGTATADMIAAHANFTFASTSTLARSVRTHAPASVIDCPNAAFPGCPAGVSVIPMVGTAPGAKVYAMKVFPSQGGGAPESRIIAAMDRAITLRRNFNHGLSTAPVSGTGTENDPFKYNALNIRVANMSLGGPTLFAGGDEEDQLTLKMLDVGITLVTSAGNDGFAAITGGSPGTGPGSLTVGASNTPVHERVLRDVQFGLGIGALYRPFNGVQTVYFSSRGPTADGRFDPELSANGLGSYTNVFAGVAGVPAGLVSCGAPGVPATGPNACASRIIFISGTSFSSPTVAGAAALLRGAAPKATATETRNALAAGANPTLITDGSGRIDQGEGFLDVSKSLALLKSHKVSDDLSGRGGRGDDDDDDADEVGQGGRSVAENLRRLGIRTVRFSNDRFTADVKTLKPGQVVQFYVPSDIFTNKLVVSISNIVREGPENQLFGDDFFVMGVDAPTSFAVGRIGDGGAFVGADTSFTIDNPQTGIVRIAVQGDWTNASRISGKVTIERARSLPTLPSAIGRIRQDDVVPYTLDIPAGTTQGVIELFWLQNWGRVPTNDLDMEILDPAGNTVLNADGDPAGASLDSPERVVLTNPAPGRYTVLVQGFLVWPQGSSGHGNSGHGSSGRGNDRAGKDTYTLTATANGQRLRVSK